MYKSFSRNLHKALLAKQCLFQLSQNFAQQSALKNTFEQLSLHPISNINSHACLNPAFLVKIDYLLKTGHTMSGPSPNMVDAKTNQTPTKLLSKLKTLNFLIKFDKYIDRVPYFH